MVLGDKQGTGIPQLLSNKLGFGNTETSVCEQKSIMIIEKSENSTKEVNPGEDAGR